MSGRSVLPVSSTDSSTDYFFPAPLIRLLQYIEHGEFRLFLSCFTSACPWRKVSSSVDGVSLNQLAGCGELLTHCSSYLTAALCCQSLSPSVKSSAGRRFQSFIGCSAVDGNCAFTDCWAWYFYLETISHNLCHRFFPRSCADSRQSKFDLVWHIPQLLLRQCFHQSCIRLGRFNDGHSLDSFFVTSVPLQT